MKKDKIFSQILTSILAFAFVFSASTGLVYSQTKSGLAKRKFTASKTTSDVFAPQVVLVPNGHAAVSLTNDGGGATLKVVDITQFGTLAQNPANLAPADSSGSMSLTQSWTSSQFGNSNVMGLAISTDGTKIYASNHPFSGGMMGIYRIGPTTSTPALLATLPGDKGVGFIDLDETHNLIFAPNQGDGKIYRVNADTGNIIDSFDQGAPDASGTALPPFGERVMGVAYNAAENRLYYSVWISTGTQIRSIGLGSDGSFNTSSDRLDFTITSSNGQAVGDFEFNYAGNKVLLGENTLFENAGTLYMTAHQSRVLEYYKNTSGSWEIDPTNSGNGLKYNVGNLSEIGKNSRSGVAWAYNSLTSNQFLGDQSYVLMTGDCLRFTSTFVYGLQFTPATGGGVLTGSSNSVIADMDYDTAGQDKAVYGDVDIRKESYALGNRVWFDTNNNGMVDGTEQGISGVYLSVFVDADQDGKPDNPNSPVDSVMTDDNGYYRFDSLMAGNYVVRVNPVNFSSRNALYGAFNTSGSSSADLDSTSVTGQNGEDGVAPASVATMIADGIFSNTVTLGSMGEPKSEADVQASGQGNRDDRANMTVDFGFYRLSLSGTVWMDTGVAGSSNPNNGILNAGESFVSGVTVRLFNSSGVEIPVGPDGILGTADDAPGGMLTDASGNYNFQGMPAGSYRVVITATGRFSSSPTSTTPDDNIDSNDDGSVGSGAFTGSIVSGIVNLSPGSAGSLGNNSVSNTSGSTSNPTIDFGLLPAAPSAGEVTISGRVTVNGNSFRGGKVILTNTRTQETKLVYTNSFGYFNFADVSAGDGYTITFIGTKSGVNETRFLEVLESLSDLRFDLIR